MLSTSYTLYIDGKPIEKAVFCGPLDSHPFWQRLIVYERTMTGRLAPVAEHTVPAYWPETPMHFRKSVIRTGGHEYAMIRDK